MTQLQGVILTAGGRGFLAATVGAVQFRGPRHARRASWYAALPVEDRETVDVWLRIWARQERERRERCRLVRAGESGAR